MDTAKKRQTTLRVTYSKVPQWRQRVRAMEQCKTTDALITLHGPPQLKVQQEGFEIWRYPLGTEEGLVYSINVSVHKDRPMQAFLFYEPDKTPKVRWWQFWK
jgi:hypothetical protein